MMADNRTQMMEEKSDAVTVFAGVETYHKRRQWHSLISMRLHESCGTCTSKI